MGNRLWTGTPYTQYHNCDNFYFIILFFFLQLLMPIIDLKFISLHITMALWPKNKHFKINQFYKYCIKNKIVQHIYSLIINGTTFIIQFQSCTRDSEIMCVTAITIIHVVKTNISNQANQSRKRERCEAAKSKPMNN